MRQLILTILVTLLMSCQVVFAKIETYDTTTNRPSPDNPDTIMVEDHHHHVSVEKCPICLAKFYLTPYIAYTFRDLIKGVADGRVELNFRGPVMVEEDGSLDLDGYLRHGRAEIKFGLEF